MAIENETQESIEEGLLEKTTARIEALGINTDDSLADEIIEDDDVVTKDDDSSTSASDKDGTEEKIIEDDDVVTKDDDSSTSASDKDGTEEKIELLDAHYRAAVHRGWKPEEIEEFFKASPELAKRTFANIYEGVNKSSQEFATLGRLKLEQQQQKSTEQTQEQGAQFKGVDVDKLRDTYGKEEPLIDVVVAIQEQNKILYEQAQTRTSQQQTQLSDKELKVFAQQIDGFFVADDLKLYEDFYGPGKNTTGNITQPAELTPGQRANRKALLVIGDEIIAGNAMQGYEMPVIEALELAHLRITAPIKEQKIRESIISKVVKRSKSITLKGSGKNQTAKEGPLSGTALERKTEERILKLLRS